MASRTELSLLEALKSGGYEASLVTTYNAYLPFYEDVVLPKLRASGCRHNVVLIDARRCAENFVQPETAPRLAGRVYTLVPVQSRGAFHPKLLMLLGKAKGLLHVGSHNLTLAGFGRNRELTSRIRKQGTNEGDAEAYLMQRAWLAVGSWLDRERERLPDEVRRTVLGLAKFAPWLRTEGKAATDYDFLYQSEKGESLWDQVVGQVPKKVNSVSIIGPFFDDQLAFVDAVIAQCPTAKIHIAVQQDTVHLPVDQRARKIDWRDASDLAGSNGYLHAKAIYFEGGGEKLLLIGSANPSAPAWLRQASRNDEAELVIRGDAAEQAAKAIGIASLDGLPRLSKQAVEAIASRRPRLESSTPGLGAPVVGTLLNRQLLVPWSAARPPAEVILYGLNGAPISEIAVSSIEDGRLPITLSAEATWPVRGLIRLDAERTIPLVIHDVRQIEQLSRSTTQQALRDALSGLGSDGTDVGQVVDLLQKAIFSKPGIDQEVLLRHGTSAGREWKRTSVRPESLVVAADQMKKRQASKRLVAADSDLGYLMDILFRELKVEAVPTGVDALGRSEEEQPGQDDPPPTLPPPQPVNDAGIADACRKKALRLIKRMIAYLEDAAAKDDPKVWLDAIVKLVAVLAVLRELRVIEQLPRWRIAHEELIPLDHRLHLIQGAVPILFGRRLDLLHKASESLGERGYEELARLKAMLLWLAWDGHINLERRLSLMDDHEEILEKLWKKSALLEIAQFLPGDDAALEEAKESVLRTCGARRRIAAGDWLQEITGLCEQAARFMAPDKWESVCEPAIGGIALVDAPAERRLRVVWNCGPAQTSLVDVSEDDCVVRFQSDRVLALAPR